MGKGLFFRLLVVLLLEVPPAPFVLHDTRLLPPFFLFPFVLSFFDTFSFSLTFSVSFSSPCTTPLGCSAVTPAVACCKPSSPPTVELETLNFLVRSFHIAGFGRGRSGLQRPLRNFCIVNTVGGGGQNSLDAVAMNSCRSDAMCGVIFMLINVVEVGVIGNPERTRRVDSELLSASDGLDAI